MKKLIFILFILLELLLSQEMTIFSEASSLRSELIDKKLKNIYIFKDISKFRIKKKISLDNIYHIKKPKELKILKDSQLPKLASKIKVSYENIGIVYEDIEWQKFFIDTSKLGNYEINGVLASGDIIIQKIQIVNSIPKEPESEGSIEEKLEDMEINMDEFDIEGMDGLDLYFPPKDIEEEEDQ